MDSVFPCVWNIWICLFACTCVLPVFILFPVIVCICLHLCFICVQLPSTSMVYIQYLCFHLSLSGYPFSVGSVQCWFCSVLVLFSVGSVQCWFCSVLVLFSVGSVQCWSTVMSPVLFLPEFQLFIVLIRLPTVISRTFVDQVPRSWKWLSELQNQAEHNVL